MGPEQALVVLFRDSNMNAMDIDELKEEGTKIAATARDFNAGICLCNEERPSSWQRVGGLLHAPANAGNTFLSKLSSLSGSYKQYSRRRVESRHHPSSTEATTYPS